MDSNILRQTTFRLANVVGVAIPRSKKRLDLLAQDSTYNLKDIDFFIDDLIQFAHDCNLMLVKRDLPLENFKSFIATTEHPILYFEKTADGFNPVLFEPNNKQDVVNPLILQNQVEDKLNNKVVFLTAFPIEPLVSAETSEEQPFTPFQRLIRLLSNERKDIGYIYFYAIAVGLISLIMPLGVQAIFNLVKTGSVFSSVYLLMGLVLIGLVISGIMQIVQVSLVETLQRRIFAKAAFEFTYRLPRIKTEALFESHPPELMNRFFDVLTIQKSLPKFLIDITSAFLQILFGLLLLSFYHPFFIAFGIIIGLILVVLVRLRGKKGLETSIKESKYKYKVVQWLEEIAMVLPSFKLAGNSILPVQKMDELVNNYLFYRAKHFKILNGFYAYALISKTLIIGGLLILGTYLLVNLKISLGQFVASEIVIVLLTAAVEKLIMSIDVIFDLLTAVDKLGHVTDLPAERESGYKFSAANCGQGLAIKVADLSYQYPTNKQKTLKSLSFNVSSGERLCITGQNGSGKNTLSKILAGIYETYEGSLMYNGISMRDLDVSSLRNHVEMNVPNQEIFDGTILENITMGRSGITLDMIQEVLQTLNIADEISKLPQGLNTPMISGGKRFAVSFTTKISLARVIVTKPKLLIFNDSLANIERVERMRIIGILTNQKQPWTLIVLSNDPAMMAACQRVIVMDDGCLKAEGEYRDLLQYDFFQELVQN